MSIGTKTRVMRKLFVLLAIGMFFISSCQKDQDFEQGIADNWEESEDNSSEWDDQDEGGEGEGEGDDEDEDGGSDGDADFDDDQEGEDGAISLYKIDGNNISKIKDFAVSDDLISYQTNDALHQEIWSFVTTLIPLRDRGKISQFELFHGRGQLLGYVAPIDGDLSKWVFALAIDEASGLGSVDFSNDFTYTVLHEHGHVLTLNDDQVDASINEDNCNNYHTGEGCSNSNSYINKIVEIGWTDIIDQHDPDDSYSTYQKYQDRFLTEYAATNPGEDIAEVFTAFVIKENKPTGNTIADQKVKSFYGFPELVTLRKNIRASLNPARLKSLNIEDYKTLLPKLVKGHKH